MGFFDDLGKKVTDAGQKAMQKTQEMSEIVRVNSLISQNENKINNAYVQIGKLFVSTYGNECEPEFAEMVATVAELEQQIAVKNVAQKFQEESFFAVHAVRLCQKPMNRRLLMIA